MLPSSILRCWGWFGTARDRVQLVDVGVEIERAEINELAGQRDGGGFVRQVVAQCEHFGGEAFGHVIVLLEA